MAERVRSPSELLRRGYSEDEIQHLYELGRMFLEHGELSRASVVFTGITEVAPDFALGWLGLAYVQILERSIDAAAASSRQALRIDPQMLEAALFLAICMLELGDYNSAGTFLGEVRERIDAGTVSDPAIIRLYKAQLARYRLR